MPVSPLPCLSPLLIVIPLLCLLKGRKAFARASAVSASFFLLLVLSVYVPGWVLMIQAHRGNPEAMYELARWTEKHNGVMNQFVIWPLNSDVQGGYAWLEQATALDYPPAVYALGVRLKYGEHVPPPGGTWVQGAVHPQPERGQALIDKALRLGYQPTIEERYFYWSQFRK